MRPAYMDLGESSSIDGQCDDTWPWHVLVTRDRGTWSSWRSDDVAASRRRVRFRRFDYSTEPIGAAISDYRTLPRLTAALGAHSSVLSSSHRLTNSRVCPRHPFRPSAVPPSVIAAVGERTAITVDIIRINWEFGGPWHCHCHRIKRSLRCGWSFLSSVSASWTVNTARGIRRVRYQC